VRCFPKVVAHQAAAQLTGGQGLGNRLEREVLIGVWLMNLMQQNITDTAAFRFSNCNLKQLTIIPLKNEYKMYEWQQKVVRKMVAC